MDNTETSADRDAMEAARVYLARELSSEATRGKPRGTPRQRRPKVKGTPAAGAVMEDRR
jgi:hypothetical protein